MCRAQSHFITRHSVGRCDHDHVSQYVRLVSHFRRYAACRFQFLVAVDLLLNIEIDDNDLIVINYIAILFIGFFEKSVKLILIVRISKLFVFSIEASENHSVIRNS